MPKWNILIGFNYNQSESGWTWKLQKFWSSFWILLTLQFLIISIIFEVYSKINLTNNLAFFLISETLIYIQKKIWKTKFEKFHLFISAPVHRVIYQDGDDRYSFPFFLGPSADSFLIPIKKFDFNKSNMTQPKQKQPKKEGLAV